MQILFVSAKGSGVGWSILWYQYLHCEEENGNHLCKTVRFKSPVPGQYNFADNFKFGCKVYSSRRFKTL
jgi:hypothetical protein